MKTKIASILLIIGSIFISLAAADDAPAYACSLDNCQSCSYTRFCGRCMENYILDMNADTGDTFCRPVLCDIEDCASCYQDSVCEICDSGYILDGEGGCLSEEIASSLTQTCKQGCLICSQAGQCKQCQFGYNLNRLGQCLQVHSNYVIEYCQAKFSQMACQLCEQGYQVSIAYQCEPIPTFSCEIEQCLICSDADSCQQCAQNYQLVPLNASSSEYYCEEMLCEIQNCERCASPDNQTTEQTIENVCVQCEANYQLINNSCVLKSYGCNVDKCVYCSDRAEFCSKCENGYVVQVLTQEKVQYEDTSDIERIIERIPLLRELLQLLGILKQKQEGVEVVIIGTVCTQVQKAQGLGLSSSLVNNCQVFGEMIPGTSTLSIGCLLCRDNFINVHGFCLADIEEADYSCQIDNCEYCIQDNVCGHCGMGYTSYLSSPGQCIKNYSPIPHCIHTPLLLPICLQCEEGYALNSQLTCSPFNEDVECMVSGCNFCLDHNECYECRAGYLMSDTGSCEATCSVANCYQCVVDENDTNSENETSLCEVCSYGYVLSSTGESCQELITLQNEIICSKLFSNCQRCSPDRCLQCSEGYVYDDYSERCCTPSPHESAYCAQYESVCSEECLQCEYGTVLLKDLMSYYSSRQLLGLQAFKEEDQIRLWSEQCVAMVCQQANCRVCHNGECLVCESGYTLTNSSSCTSYTTDNSDGICQNCVLCDQSSQQCLQCLNGYLLYEGACVCRFQNCLACMGAVLCTECAPPTTLSFTDGGCLPPIAEHVECLLQNCHKCSSKSSCAECAQGYTLNEGGQCVKNTCDLSTNCHLCSVEGNICYECNQGSTFKSLFSSECVEIGADYECQIAGCSVCLSKEACQYCLEPFYSLNTETNLCEKVVCPQNCMACHNSQSCILCSQGYSLTVSEQSIICSDLSTTTTSTTLSCTDIDSHCLLCSQIEGLCLLCEIGWQPNQDEQNDEAGCIQQMCLDPNCALCPHSADVCSICSQGYYLDSLQVCVEYQLLDSMDCGVYNCLWCSNDDSCSLCASQWQPIRPSTQNNTICLSSQSCSVDHCSKCSQPNICYECEQLYTLTETSTTGQSSSYQCIPQCDVEHCLLCETLSTCAQCNQKFTLFSSGTICDCPTYIITDNGTCQCPEGTKQYENQCIVCEIENCAACDEVDSCVQCEDTYQLQNNSCSCPQTYIEDSGSCVCTDGQLPNLSSDDQQCVVCDVQDCLYCTSENICSQCSNNLQLSSNNSCICPETYIQVEQQCICPDNYKQDPSQNVCIECTVDNCVYCSEANICEECVNDLVVLEEGDQNGTCGCENSNYSLDTDAGQCYECEVDNCLLCTSDNICGECEDGFVGVDREGDGVLECQCPEFFVYNPGIGQCVFCTEPGCEYCSERNVCQQCQGDYSLLSVGDNKLCMLCAVDGCEVCSGPNKCESCSDHSLELSWNAQQCVECSVQNCYRCSGDNVCGVCQEGFVPSDDGLACVEDQQLGCLSYDSDGKCIQCDYGMNLSEEATCDICIYPCQSCLDGSNTLCQTCQSPFNPLAASDGTCFLCSVANCQQCSSSDSLTCQTCADQYQLSFDDSQCVPASTNTEGCSPQCQECLLDQFCEECSNGYATNLQTTESQCTQCSNLDSPGCLKCSPTDLTTCYECADGFSMVEEECQQCLFSNCKKCYGQSQSECLEYKEGTEQVAVLVRQNGYKVKPSQCDPGCQKCSQTDTSLCLQCQDGYSLDLDNGVCIACEYPCRSCLADEPASCTSCYPDATQETSRITSNITIVECIVCDEESNCLTCQPSNASQCLICPHGSYLEGGACRSGCPENCLACESSTECSKCASGYFLSQLWTSTSTCLPCLSNCRYCSPSSPSTCLQCGSGFYLNLEGVCTSCPQYCQSCSPVGCDICMPGYYLLPDLTCGVVCQYPCATCSQQNPNICSSCQLGFSLDEILSVCVEEECSQGICGVCPRGRMLVSSAENIQRCEKCQVQDCARCNQDDQCLSCMPGFYLNTTEDLTSCESCPSSCLECSSPSTCDKCQSGFVIPLQPIKTSQRLCSPCDAPCSECINSTSLCLSCISGYSLSGWKCVSTFNYAFKLSLDTTLKNFYANFQSFLSDLAAALSVDGQSTSRDAVTIISITVGSVNIDGELTTSYPPDSQEAATQFSNVQNVLNSGSSISGMTILSSDVESEGGTIPEPQETGGSSNTTLIIALSVVIVVIVCVVIGWILYRRRKRQSMLREQMMRDSMEMSRIQKQAVETSKMEKMTMESER